MGESDRNSTAQTPSCSRYECYLAGEIKSRKLLHRMVVIVAMGEIC
jgi:hypothetical protein